MYESVSESHHITAVVCHYIMQWQTFSTILPRDQLISTVLLAAIFGLKRNFWFPKSTPYAVYGSKNRINCFYYSFILHNFQSIFANFYACIYRILSKTVGRPTGLPYTNKPPLLGTCGAKAALKIDRPLPAGRHCSAFCRQNLAETRRLKSC